MLHFHNPVKRFFRRPTTSPSENALSIADTRQVLRIERCRTDRTGLEFCLLGISATSGNLPAEHRKQLIHYLHRRLRITDHIGQLDKSTLAVILSATGREDSLTVVNDILKAFQDAPLDIDIYTYPDDSWFDRETLDHDSADKDIAPQNPLATLFVRPLPFSKRASDVIFSLIAVVVLLPLMLIIAVCVKLSSRGPVLFSQLRNGIGGRPFRMLKFRSMIADAERRKHDLIEHSVQDGPAFKMDDDPRVTPVGRFLRALSLDELPQLWHVLCGDMSIVGPRPLPCKETDGCEDWQLERLDVAPGLTCTWQIHGTRVTFSEWMRMDIQYVREHNLLRDLGMTIKTACVVLWKRDGT